jgi:hypothetical protein
MCVIKNHPSATFALRQTSTVVKCHEHGDQDGMPGVIYSEPIPLANGVGSLIIRFESKWTCHLIEHLDQFIALDSVLFCFAQAFSPLITHGQE